ncbi:MAG TPA: ABATE domain-containing protein [Candidatus Limnocylindria bacterium]|nr:ABATE domain-containing protein [Candidatus Limnocylindria bacterium]
MQHTPPPADHDMELIAGALCLDFTNTIGGTHEAPTHEHLNSYADLVTFARSAGTLPPAADKRLLAEAERHPEIATQMYRRGISLREAIARAFSSIAAGRAPTASDLAVIGEVTADAHAHARVIRTANGFEWTWADDDASLARPLWAIARSATEILTSDAELDRVRECASETCSWLFLDRSRNHSRRWCDMSDCGNRAKQRRFQQRQARAARKAR